MVNAFLNLKTKQRFQYNISQEDIENAKNILFSIFTRYGDTIINLVVIKEFIAKYPQKNYLILVPRQMAAYVKEFLPNINYFALNKRNIIDMLKVNFLLTKFKADIGFNPWSNGMDSCYFLTYCKKYLCYKDFIKPKIINHYEVVRSYLQLPNIKWHIKELCLNKKYKNILICPQSTDNNRSIDTQTTNDIIDNVLKQYNAKITLAYMNKKYWNNRCNNIVLKKSNNSSLQFLTTMKQSDLVICADSAPLHLALALNKDVSAYFYITQAEIVVNTNSSLRIINE